MILYIDVHYAFVQNGLVYMQLEGVDKRIEEGYGGYKILSREDQLLHLFFHNLIGKGRLQKKHLPTVRKITAHSLDLNYLKRIAKDRIIWEVLSRFLQDPNSFSEDEDVFREAAEKVRSRVLRRSFGNLWREAYRRCWNGWFRKRRGVHLSFLGVDGAGKSTLIREVQQKLAAFGKVKVDTVYMGPWGQSRTALMKWCLRRKIIPSRHDWRGILKGFAVEGRDRYPLFFIAKKMIFSEVKGWFYFAALYWDLWHRYLREIRPGLRKGRVILSDRYIYDARYIYKKRTIRHHRGWRRFMCVCFPKPDLIFYLYNTANEVVRRKPQLGEEQVEAFQEYYVKALEALPVREIRTDRAADELAIEVTDGIVRLYLATR